MVKNCIRSLALLIVVVALSCEPVELPEPQSDEPVFTLSGTLDGASFTLAAGIDQYFMFTDAYPVDDGRYIAEGRLAELDCSSDCLPSWRFEFKGSPERLSNLLGADTVGYTQPGRVTVDTSYRLHLQASSTHLLNTAVLQHRWLLNDSLVATDATLSLPVQLDNEYPLALETLTEDSCYSYTEQVIRARPQAPQCAANFYIDSTLLDASVIATALPDGELPAQFLWQDSIPGDVITFPTPATATSLCLQATYADGCTARSCQMIQPAIGSFPTSTCRNAIVSETRIDTSTVVVPDIAEGVSIHYQNEDGISYSSNAGQQPTGSYFRILEASPFENNAAGQPTIKLTVAFRCQLFTQQGDPWRAVEGEGVIAVALP
ncbi:MAG: hypothetical protein GVY26_15440 [Bacteroidetes bacterium]|jgi:hypothetical protein|nr:hypothetical protein [Bacteroidota bacterium]